MKTTMVRYRVKADRAAENESYISRVYEQLKSNQPASFHYATFKMPDGVSFVHLATQEGETGPNVLGDLGAFKEFIARIKDRCEEQPVAVDLTEVGSYNFFSN